MISRSPTSGGFAISTGALLAWGLCFWCVYQLKQGMETETGKKLVEAVIDWLKRPKPKEEE